MTHEHVWSRMHTDENDDRVRTRDTCDCGAVRYGCKAKRLASAPDQNGSREAWGPVGVQCYEIVEAK